MRDGRVPPRGVRLSETVNLEDVRAISTRTLPAAVNDFIEGGGGDEFTIRRNREAFEELEFERRALVDVSNRDLSTTILGTGVSMPVGLAPVGLAALAHPTGEKAAAVAAANKGIISTLSSSSCWSLEEVSEATDGPKWFQLYIWKDRSVTEAILERARVAGYTALVLTVDVPVGARRERDLRNGFEVPPRPSIRHAADALRHVGWFRRMAWDEAFGHGLAMGNFTADKGGLKGRMVMMEVVNKLFDPSVTWNDIEWLKSVWNAPLVVKGVTTAFDAKAAVDHGADAVWISNHGGRQLDSLPATIDVLPEIASALDGQVEIYLDGGVRRGADVVKAVARGARACMIGRPYVYGLAAGGQAGVERVLDHFRTEIDATLALLGCTSIAGLDESYLRR